MILITTSYPILTVKYNNISDIGVTGADTSHSYFKFLLTLYAAEPKAAASASRTPVAFELSPNPSLK